MSLLYDNGSPFVLTVSGELGSGKSSVTSALELFYTVKRVSTGDFFRAMALERGTSVVALNKAAETDPSIDRAIDGSTAAIKIPDGGIIVDGRMAWYFLPDTFRVYLLCDEKTGAERIYNAKRPDERTESVAEMITNNRVRRESECRRYMEYYGADCSDLNNFDAVLDTTGITEAEAISLTRDLVEARRSGLPFERFRFFPANLSITGESAEDGEVTVSEKDGEYRVLTGASLVRAAKERGDSLITAASVTKE